MKCRRWTFHVKRRARLDELAARGLCRRRRARSSSRCSGAGRRGAVRDHDRARSGGRGRRPRRRRLAGLAVPELRERTPRSPTSGAAAGSRASCWRRRVPTRASRSSRASGKKCAFLRGPRRGPGSRNVEVVHARAEEWTAGLGAMDVVTARALAPTACPGRVRRAAARGRRGPRGLEGPPRRGRGATTRAAAAEVLGLDVEAAVPVAPRPGADERHLVVLRKVAPTPAGYPRRPGMARKRPLGAASSRPAERSRTRDGGGCRPPSAATFALEWARSTRSRTRRAGSGRRRRRSTSPPASPRPATRRCSSTSTRRRTRPSALGLPKHAGPEPLRRAARRGRRPTRRSCRTDVEGLSLLPASPGPRRRRRSSCRGRAPRRGGCATRSRPCASASPTSCSTARPSLGPLTVNALVAADRVIVPGPDRVLRARGPRRPARHARARPARAEPAPDGRGHAPDDARRAHAPRARRRARGARALPRPRLRHRDPAQRAHRRGAELRPPRDPPRPALRRVRTPTSSSPRRWRSVAEARRGMGRGLAAILAVSDEASRGAARAARARGRADRPEPGAAPPPLRRRGARRARRLGPRARACCSRSSFGREPAGATSSSPASAAGAPPSSPASRRSRRSCRRATTRRRSRRRSSRTWPARTSTRSRRRAPSPRSSRSWGSRARTSAGASAAAASRSRTCCACSTCPTRSLELLEEGRLTEGHGRALLLADDHAARRRSRATPRARAGRCASSRTRAREAGRVAATARAGQRDRGPSRPGGRGRGDRRGARPAPSAGRSRVRPARAPATRSNWPSPTLDEALALARRVRSAAGA